MQEIIQPGGATKKPQDSALESFAKSCASFEPSVVCSTLYYVLVDQKISWISKYVS